tara:strand:+ start:652 stop:825 length:174 start_codon:yes stop_codon:yes gene_type:complete
MNYELTTFSHSKIRHGVDIKKELKEIKEKQGIPVSRICEDGVVHEIKKYRKLSNKRK